MTVAGSDALMEAMRGRTTDDLLAIWKENDRNRWSGAEFDTISDVLFERGIVAPFQEGHFTRFSSLSGVRGWLLFLCIRLVFIGPIANFIVLLGLFQAEEFANDRSFLWALTIFGAFMCGFGIYAGVELWRVAPGAVKKAKAFFWSYLALTVAGGILEFTLADGASFKDLSELSSSVIFSCFWLLYLMRSNRVRNTYGS